LLAGAACAFVVLAPAVARAGDWIQVSCMNTDGSSAPSEGWTPTSNGTPEASSYVDTNCTSTSPMDATLGAGAPASTGTQEALQYTPPTGSTLAGGSVDVNLYADSGGPGGSGDAVLYSPNFAYDSSDVFYQCAQALPGCKTFSGVVSLPTNRGGNFYAGALCGGTNGSCTSGASENAWAYAQVVWARLVLFNSSSPGASGFAGSLLSPNAFGTADVSFTASDPGGPGVYNVTAKVDGTTVYAANPDTNSGHCVSVGTDTASGAFMFDWQQPCPTTEFVDVPVSTAGLVDGRHQLTVAVTDAAQNTSTVLNETITTRQSGTGTVLTPPPKPHHVRAKLVIVSHYSGDHTRLVSIDAHGLPHNAQIAVRCRGRGCPRPSARTASTRRVRGLWRALTHEVFAAGDRVIFTIAAPGLLPERSELVIRKDAKPVAKRL
jgi:hypothetical protein